MDYQELIVKELRGMMRDRLIPERSRFTRKQDIIDRLIQDDQEAANNQGTASFTGSPPESPLAPEPAPDREPIPDKIVPFSPRPRRDRPPVKQKIITFSRTKDRLLLGDKTVTRRIWAKRTLLTWQKAWDEGRHCHRAYDKLPHHGGEQIGEIRLIQRPYLEKLADLPDADVAAEGYPELTSLQFIDRFFPGDGDRLLAVIRFVFIPDSKSSMSEDFDQNADSFRVTPEQIKFKLNQIVEKELHKPRIGEYVRFIHSPSELSSDIDRAIADHLNAHPDLKYAGKITKEWDPLKKSNHLFEGVLTRFYGWHLYPDKIEYNHYPYCFLWVTYNQRITEEGQFYQEFQQVIKNLLTHNIGSRHFGPVLDPSKMSQIDWRKSPWLFGNLNGYWLVREEPDLASSQTFRWWWTEAAGWRLDFNRVKILPDETMRCPCQRESCGHLKAIRLHRQREYLQQKEARGRLEAKERNQEIAQVEKERAELSDWLKDNHFQEAANIGHKLFRQPFWGLSLDCLQQIRAQLKIPK